MPSRNIGKMNQRTISHLSSFWLVLVLAFGLSGAFTVIPKPFRNNYVRIVNNLNNELLYYHCKSRDTDFHLKNLQTNTYWEFSFRQNVIGTTLYYCKFWQYNFHAVFDVFTSNEKFQRECGGDHCIWIAQEDGVYLYELKKQTSVKMPNRKIHREGRSVQHARGVPSLNLGATITPPLHNGSFP